MTCKEKVKNEYIDILEGNLPIIITAAHGGDDKPSNIKDRASGVFDKDDYTKELTQAIYKEFFAQTKQYPNTVIMNLSRNKIDANRDVFEAIEMDDKNALEAYNSFHKAINKSFDKIKSIHKYGLYFDIHGQSHSHQNIELGYLLTNDILKLDSNTLEKHKEDSSLNSIVNISNKGFIQTLNGEFSLGSLLKNKGFDTIPSSKNKYAKNDDEYFEGAFNTKSYRLIGSPTITTIQCEFPYKCRETEENRNAIAKAFVSSVLEFYKIHFGVDFVDTRV